MRIQSHLPQGMCVGEGVGDTGWSQALRVSQGSLHLNLPRVTISSWQNLLLQLALSLPQPVPSALFPWVKFPWHGADKGSEPRTLPEVLGKIITWEAAQGLLPVAPHFHHHSVPTESKDALHPLHYSLEGLRQSAAQEEGSGYKKFLSFSDCRGLCGGWG